jgi:hypothetical protein
VRGDKPAARGALVGGTRAGFEGRADPDPAGEVERSRTQRTGLYALAGVWVVVAVVVAVIIALVIVRGNGKDET